MSQTKEFREFEFGKFGFARPVKYVKRHLSSIDHDPSKGET